MTWARFKRAVVDLFSLCCVLWVLPATSSMAGDLHVAPNVIHVGTFFSGATVEVSGRVPQGSDIVVELYGEPVEEELMKKGRRGGLWMNVGEVRASGAPSLYMVMSNSAELLMEETKGSSWGYSVIKKATKIEGLDEQEDPPGLLEHFLRLKERDGLYRRLPGALEISPSEGERWTVNGQFPLPAKVKPGLYQVCLRTIRGGKTKEMECMPLEVRRVGFPAFLHDLAMKHGTLYGILSVVIALVTGYVIGLIFRKGGAH